MFELNIVAAPQAPKQKRSVAPAAQVKPVEQPRLQPKELDAKAAKQTPLPAACPAPDSSMPLERRKPKRPREYDRPASQGTAEEARVTVANAVGTFAPQKPAKRTRYASGSASQAVYIRKEDPTRAAALPETLSLDAAAARAHAFSATCFAELKLNQYLQRHITQRMELTKLTPVQQHAIPILLNGGDLLVRSPTGSGKTLAYAVPVVEALIRSGPGTVARSAGTFGVILVPTRELCIQTHEVVSFTSHEMVNQVVLNNF